MKDEDEVREMLEKVLVKYDESAEGGKTPSDWFSAIRMALEWVLGENEDDLAE